MNIEDIRDFCISLPPTTEGFPCGDDYLVFKVLGKIFLITNLNKIPMSISIKCNPNWAVELRDEYTEITAGYHLNKKHWNTIEAEFLPNDFVIKMIKHSYNEVINKLPKKLKINKLT